MKPTISRSWRFNKITEVITSDILQGNPENQYFTVSGIDWHIGVKLVCAKCSKTFVFSAKEQQNWYENLKFWADSVPIECRNCRAAKRSIINLNKRLCKVLSVKSMQISDYNEIVDVAFEMISSGVVIGGRLAQKIKMASKKVDSLDAK